jgi:hypothetical protein
MIVLFFFGFSNPFPGAGWTRIGFLQSTLRIEDMMWLLLEYSHRKA